MARKVQPARERVVGLVVRVNGYEVAGELSFAAAEMVGGAMYVRLWGNTAGWMGG